MNNNIYVVPDLHGDLEITKLSVKNWPIQKSFDGSEIIIQVGDFGLVWDQIESRTEKYWLDWLNDKPFKTVFIDGNHENFNRLYTFPKDEKFGNTVRIIRDNIYHLQRGNIYNIYGNSFLCFGGARSHDRNWRTNQLSWWPEEEASMKEMDNCRKSIKNANCSVDYVITHTLPTKIIGKIFGILYYRRDYTSQFLQTLIDDYNLKFKHWWSGHMHEDKDYDNFSILQNRIVKVT